MPSEKDIMALILGGGAGSRLKPLTFMRSKPAVPFGGKYRLIDIPISNCINSGIHRIAVLTQFNSVSLHRHITKTYNFDAFHNGFVQIWAAEQTPQNQTWYQGTADAVRKQLLEIKSARADYVIILAGDHLYRMDYSLMARYHWETNAEVTVAVQPVRAEQASAFGILHRQADGRITNFVEKPSDPEILKTLVSRDDPARPYLGSMGIYIFNFKALVEGLEDTTSDDFGHDVIPKAIQTRRVYGYDFDDYWEDIGTIRSFYETNLRLAQPNPPFDFHDPAGPIYTRARFLPGSTFAGACMTNVLLAEGCLIGKADIENSVIGLRSQIGNGVKIKDTVLMGGDYYVDVRLDAPKSVDVGIGDNCDIEGALIDKNARIGAGVVIRSFPLGTELVGDYHRVRDGIVVIPKNTLIPPGTYIGPDQG